jgi:D-beta-D-heptose 7-phosphate kinase/D-beta-D-heptose 1-phosphate adenosyltransferase
MSGGPLAALIPRLAGHRVAVIGDVMLDHFTIGRVDRISPEAPVPVMVFERDEYRLGGAANVANNVVGLDGRVDVVGLVGRDDGAAELARQMEAAGMHGGDLVVDPSRPTTSKTRIVTSRNQQVARVDREFDGDAAGEALAGLVARIAAVVARADTVVLSDYRKGVVTPQTITAAVTAAAARKIPVLVDPKVADVDRYRGTTLITPNHHEAELMTQTAIRTTADASRAARRLHARTGANVLITWGEHGMWILDAARAPAVEQALPAIAREVSDVTGAGDTVIAVLALATAAGAPLVEAARLANIAAGLAVARFGPTTVTPGELLAALSSLGA